MQGTDNRFQHNKAQSDGLQEDNTTSKFDNIIKTISRPLRTFQFMVSLQIFVFVVYTVVLGDQNVPPATFIFLIALSGMYVFALAVDLISQYSGGELNALQAFLLSLFGMIFFGIGAILAISVYGAYAAWYILSVLCLCFLMCVLCMIHVAIVLTSWKRKSSTCKECCCSQRVELLKPQFCHPTCSETVKYDLMTSVSNLRIPSGDDDGQCEQCDHSNRKVGYGHRRQYADYATSAQTVSAVDAAEVQTEPRMVFTIQCQTEQEMKEIPVQTVSRCELCNRQMQYYPTSLAAAQPAAQQAQCAPCPALVQLIRGVPCCPGCRCVTGIVQLQQQQEQQKQEQTTKEQVQWVQSMEEKPYGMLTSADDKSKDPKMKEMGGTITKLTVASYTVAPSKRTTTSSQTTEADGAKTVKKTVDSVAPKKPRAGMARKEKAGEKEDTKKQREILIPEKEKAGIDVKKGTPRSSFRKTSESNAEKIVEFSSTKSMDMPPPQSTPEKSTVSAVERPSSASLKDVPWGRESNKATPTEKVAKMITRLKEIEGTKSNVELTADSQVSTDKEGTAKTRTAAKKLNDSGDTMGQDTTNIQAVKSEETRSIGGKDEGSPKSSRKGVAKVEQSLNTASPLQPQMGTQTMQAGDTSRSKKTHLIRKKNKVEPAELTHADMNVQTFEGKDNDDISPAPISYKPESERLFTDEKEVVSVDDKVVNICPSCKRIQSSPTSSPFRYYSVHKDKRGRLYCEYCATANCIKVLHGNEGSEQKRLKCAGCGNFLRIRTSQDESFRTKPDNCPNCNQVRVHSAPSK